ncbi:MAG: hypothetical protein JWQ27_1033 [Ferruginibacter sp.]|nr:hypothetical protein [Ferruginibacter sp.]
MRKKIKWLIPFLLIPFAMHAQSPGEAIAAFPGMDMVYQNYTQQLKLSIKDGVPVAERNQEIDILMLTDKNSNMLSRYAVYHSGYNELTELEAYTLVPAGNKFKQIKSSDKKTSGSSGNNVFYDDTKETTFNFNGLTQNAIAHVSYSQFLKDAHLLSAFFPPTNMPVLNSSFSVTVPNNIKIAYVVKNDPKGLFQFTQDKKKKESVYTWTLKNRKSVTDYGNAPNERYFEPHVIVYITSYETDQGTQPFLNSVQDLYTWNISFLKDLNKVPDPILKSIVDSLTKNETDEKIKALKIYQWVQHHIRYVAFEAGEEGFRPRQAGDVCAKRYGDCKDMSSIITQMMRMAGIKAYYTWIGTRDLPYSYAETPVPMVDNHMISTARINGEWMFFDGTDANAKFDMPPAFIQGKEAMVGIDDTKYQLLTIPVANPQKSVITDSTYINISEQGVSGYEVVNYAGYFGKEVYSSLMYRDEKETKDYVNKRMSKGSNKFILGNFDIVRSAPDQNEARINAHFEIPGYSKKVGDEYYINLNLEKLLENQQIDLEKRQVPLETEFNSCINQYHILAIPEGYQVASVPKNFSFENDLIKIQFYYKVIDGKVIAAQEIQNKKLLLGTQDFKEWNKPMKDVQAFYKESVVLEKK